MILLTGKISRPAQRRQDLALEPLALKQKGPLFEETFGLKVLLRKGRG